MTRRQSVREFQESVAAPTAAGGTFPRDEEVRSIRAADRYAPDLPVAELRESALNPRKRFDAAGLEELTSSIREKGVLTPLLARPVPGWSQMPDAEGRHYEIAAGHRRFRAAQAAGLREVPVVLREMTNAELLEVLVIENGQREDVHPLEEAAGYQALLRIGYDVARIAGRVGRSVEYVYGRMKLLSLTKEAQQLFLDGKFTAGHAILLARLKAEDQKRALSIDDGDGILRHPALFQEARGLPFDDDSFEKAVRKDPYLAVKPVSVREFGHWIEERVKFDRDQVDPVLFPETAETLALARDAKLKIVPITRDYCASDEVRQAGKERVYGEQAWQRADGKEQSKTCERARVGLVVCGPGQGEAFKVCIDKERCAVHWAAWQRDRKKRQAGQGGETRAREQERWKLEQEKRRQEQARREAEQERWKKARPAILQALAGALKKAAATPAGEMARLILGRCQDNYHARNVPHEKYLPKGRTAEDLVRHAAFVVLCDLLHEWTAPEEFPKRARAFGVDVRKIVDRVAPPEVQTSAKPATGSSEKRINARKASGR